MPKKSPDKFLVEFLAQWIRDEKLRCKVLKDERTELKNFGLGPRAVDVLVSLNNQRILRQLREELEEHFEMYPAKTYKAIHGTGVSARAGGFTGMLWQEGSAHVRRVEPNKIKKAQESTVTVLGHGYDRSLQVWFEPMGGGKRVRGRVKKPIDCDTDIWQRAKVKVSLPTAGKWRVVARVPTYLKQKESDEVVALRVT